MTETTYKIHPALGIARMGNFDPNAGDPTTYFTGAEAPYQVPNEGNPYKVNGQLKRQAQRFRIYEYQDGVAVREITLHEDDIADINWHVRVGNRKSALDTSGKNPNPVSNPTHQPRDYLPSVTRNQDVPPEKRDSLCIDTGWVSVSAAQGQDLHGSITMYAENQPKPSGGGNPPPESKLPNPISTSVSLGRVSGMSDTGHLLVMASDGLSEGVLDGAFSKAAYFGNAENENEFANSDNWYDTTGDGPVQATITFKNGETVTIDDPAHSAWVLLVLPKYAPAFNQFTDLQHVAQSALHDFDGPTPIPSFAVDIYPILRSVSQLQWVSGKGMLGHGTGRNGYYLDASSMKKLSDNDPDPTHDPFKARNAVFSRIRNPFEIPQRPYTELTDELIKPTQMPQLPDEVIKTPSPKDWDLGSVTKLQYLKLKEWRDGNFDPDPDGIYDYKPLSDYAVADQPAALDRAAVEGSTGSPFYPGIESWSIMANPAIYAAPMRIKSDVQPGDLTMGNALPWQADYLDCSDTWWPVQRPDEVLRDGKTLQSWTPVEWDGGGPDPDYGSMVQHWWGLGFVYTKDDGKTYAEYERSLDSSNA